MARGFRHGGAGGGGASKFPWNLFAVGTWDKKTNVVNGNKTGYMTCSTFSPVIENGCFIKYTGNQTQGANNGNRTALQISTDGTNWTEVWELGGTTIDKTYQLTNYIGGSIQVRLRCKNAGSVDHTFTMQSCIVDKE